MAKNNGGMFSFLIGMAAGAGALFLSKEKNRKKTEALVRKISRETNKAKIAYKKDPQAFKAQAKAKVRRVVKRAVKKAQT